MADEYSIGVDLGGTNLRAAAVDGTGKLLEKTAAATPAGSGRDAIVAGMVHAIQDIRGRLGDRTLAGVGIGVPGFVLLKEGIIAGSANLPDFDDYPVRDEIEQRLGTRVILENDANAAALGESWIGSGQGVQNLIMLTLGTGLGGGIIVGGRVLHGEQGMAGELGHITVDPSGYPCGCGNWGCVEKYASATAVSAMAKLLNLGSNLSAADVQALAAAGDERAVQIFETVGRSLGVLIAGLINTFNFPLVLIGGGVMGAWDQFSPAMLTEVERRSFTYRSNKARGTAPRIEKAKLGNMAGLYGAAYLPYTV
jgi:glucokinase